MKIAYILKLRDDIDIIKYNLYYYHSIGIRDFFIMLHKPTAILLKILDKIQNNLTDSNFTFLYWDKEGKGLNPANEDYLKLLTNTAQDYGFKWIVGSDADEFLILRKHKNIYDLISEYDKCNITSLIFRWANYRLTSDNETLFYKDMQHRAPYFDLSTGWTKAVGKFSRSMYFVQGLHHIANDYYGQTKPPLERIYIDPEIAYYAHFPFRTKQQFIDKQKIQGEKFKDWRYQKDDQFFENIWHNFIKERSWPDNMDNEIKFTNDYNKTFIYDPVNFDGIRDKWKIDV